MTPFDEIREWLAIVEEPISTALAPSGSTFGTVLTAYAGTTTPMDEASRRACITDRVRYATTSFATLDGLDAVTIPANSSVQVHVAAYNAYDASAPQKSTGPVLLNVRTDAFAP